MPNRNNEFSLSRSKDRPVEKKNTFIYSPQTPKKLIENLVAENSITIKSMLQRQILFLLLLLQYLPFKGESKPTNYNSPPYNQFIVL